MIFNSIEFAIFLPVVFLLYWFVFNKGIKIQNIFIVAASFLFYGWWDWRFLFLMILTALLDFLIAGFLDKTDNKRSRRILLLTSILSNLIVLGYFKYYNFFATNFVKAFTFFGHPIQLRALSIVLPVGISFYTFQALSYTIDVYRRQLSASKSMFEYFAFISFFPQLVAGPIERATHLLPQFQRKRYFDLNLASDGMRQILWGLFKKMVIADNCALLVNEVFNGYQSFSAPALIAGAFLFAFQIYGDFSGYSDIAIGTSRLFGFEIMRNFAFPYFSRDIAEFWRRWHISLSTWFRDYIYIPLGGSKVPKCRAILNIFIIFIVSGFWHGANWTFIAWGFINAVFFLPLLLLKSNRLNLRIVAEEGIFPSYRETFQILLTFSMTLFAWIFFRSNSLLDALHYISNIFSWRNGASISISTPLLLMITLFIVTEWLQRRNAHALDFSTIVIPFYLRWGLYLFISSLILFLSGGQQDFIYFQF